MTRSELRTPLAYDVAGDGPAVVFVHGAMVDRRMWDAQFDRFARYFRTVRYDAAGMGESPMPAGRLNNREDLRCLLDALGIRDAHLVGLSMGARMAMEFALAYPLRVRSLVLTMGRLPGHAEDGMPVDIERGLRKVVAAAKDGDFEAATQQSLHLSLLQPAAAIPAVRAKLERMLRDHTWVRETTEVIFEALRPAAGQRVGELTMPMLVVQGDREIDQFRRIGWAVAHEAPRGALIELAGAGHVVNMERPVAYNRAVLEFLRDVDDTRSGVADIRAHHRLGTG